jgi:hypothetical protein
LHSPIIVSRKLNWLDSACLEEMGETVREYLKNICTEFEMHIIMGILKD